MKKVRSKNTKPEMQVRRLVYGMGYRYRLHRSDLPGKPDIAFIGRRKVIFVHGCFWHGHDCPSGRKIPKTNTSYWIQKLRRNQERDIQHRTQLQNEGWEVLVVWECQLKNIELLSQRIHNFLDESSIPHDS